MEWKEFKLIVEMCAGNKLKKLICISDFMKHLLSGLFIKGNEQLKSVE